MTLPSYICLEGVDGAGKSLQLSMLGDYFTVHDITPVKLYEPSYGPFGREIRDRAVDGAIGALDAQRLLFTADRRDHISRKIVPLLAFVRSTPGFVILQSRSYISAAAYQAPADDDATLNAIVAEQESFAPRPDLILILDVPVELALSRMRSRSERTVFEVPEILGRVRQRYRQIARMCSLCVLVDASADPDVVALRIQDAIAERGERTT